MRCSLNNKKKSVLGNWQIGTAPSHLGNGEIADVAASPGPVGYQPVVRWPLSEFERCRLSAGHHLCSQWETRPGVCETLMENKDWVVLRHRENRKDFTCSCYGVFINNINDTLHKSTTIMCLFGNTFKIGNNYIAINGSKNEKDCLVKNQILHSWKSWWQTYKFQNIY